MKNKSLYTIGGLLVVAVVAVAVTMGQSGFFQGNLGGIPGPTTLPLPKSKPVVEKVDPVAGSFSLPQSFATKIFKMKITAQGPEILISTQGPNKVSFIGAKGNQIQVDFEGRRAGANFGAGNSFQCSLTDGGAAKYSTLTVSSPGVQKFIFNDASLSIQPGFSAFVYVECDTTGFTTSGDNITANLLSDKKTVQWTDGVTPNINYVLTVPVKLVGPAFTTN